MERKGGTALSRQTGCLGSRCSIQTAFSPSISPAPHGWVLCILGKFSSTELYSQSYPFISEASRVV